MPVFPPFFNNLVEARINMLNPNGQVCNNVLYLGRNSAETFSDEVDSMHTKITAWLTAFKDQIATTFGWVDVDYLDRSVANGQAITKTLGFNGTDTANPLPPQIALVITWKTNNSGRRYRGRSYLAGFTETNNTTDGYPTSACVTDVQAATDAFLASLDTDGQGVAVLSRGGPTKHKDGTETTWTPFATVVTSAAIDTVWDTQRRRRP